MSDNQYLVAVSLLFITYVGFEVPSNLVLKKFRPSRYIGAIATIWGIIASLTGITQSYGGLIACRLLLGVAEAGLFPGMTIYLTLFYGKHELALRVGYLFVSSAIAGACGGLLAFAIGYMGGVSGLSGWRWIMIIEGIPTFIVGISCFFGLADDPQSARYLNDEEKRLMQRRREREDGYTKLSEEFHWDDAKEAAQDWKVWLFCCGQFGGDTMLYGFSTFLPTIIQGLGTYSSAQVQALTIPVYAVGAISYLIVARLSDSHQKRAVYTIAFGLVAVIGYAIMVSDVSSGAHYFGCFLIAFGLYVLVGLPLAWLPSNSPRYGKRTTSTGMQLTFGNSSGVMAPFVSFFFQGNGVSLIGLISYIKQPKVRAMSKAMQ
jgi:MFS family permease